MTRKGQTIRSTRKRPYRSPVLSEYGDLEKLTLNKGGTKNDGGGRPRTRC